jgi:deoxyribodipyrimidine photo-lyase
MKSEFPTDYTSILDRIHEVNPVKYGSSRNYINGAVTYLSPYISRGVISTRQVLEHVLAKGYKLNQIESFVKELCWRDYFQRVAQEKDLQQNIRQPQMPVSNHEVPIAILNANTGIEGIDAAISKLYDSGYMHNHCRMYVASLVCNIAQSHWLLASKWMYYHLLDGDFASNICSWQWVAGANSGKKYYANQENINKYTLTKQSHTFLDTSYERISEMDIPSELLATQKINFTTTLPETKPLQIDFELPTFIYNYYNLDLLWHQNEKGNRILLLEPKFFDKYPVSPKCIDFLLALSQNIPEIQVFVGSFESLVLQYPLKNIYFKEHPLNIGYKGTIESRDWISTSVTGYYPSFFAYWKKVEKELYKKYNSL